jgi:hypothetical protein
MNLTPYVDFVQRELAVAADAGGDDARALAERLTAPLESAVRLALLEALSDATAEITRDLAPGSVYVRLRGREPDFLVTSRPAEQPRDDQPPVADATPRMNDAPDPDRSDGSDGSLDDGSSLPGDRGATSRINLRLPDDVKARVEEAAGRERISANAWLVRAAEAALTAGRATGPATGHRGYGHSQRFTGWAR